MELREGQQQALRGLKHRLADLINGGPDDASLARAWHTTGVLHLRLNEFQRAEAALLEALRLIDDSPSRLWILDSLGQCNQGEGAWSEARRLLQAVARAKENSGEVLGTAISIGNLALLELGLGHNSSAEAALRDVLVRLEPQLPALTRVRLHTLLLQSVLQTPRQTDQALRLEAVLAETGQASHHLKAFAALAMARARPDDADIWLRRAERLQRPG